MASLSFREKCARLFTNNYFIVIVLVGMFTLSYFNGALGFFVPLVVILATLWATRWDWSYFGLGKPKWGESALRAIGYAVGTFIVIDILIQPFIEIYVGNIDLSSFDGLKGNWLNTLMFMGVMWLIAGIGEEIVYRGYVLNRIARIIGRENTGWYIAIILTSVLFGLAHMYQGWSGVLTTGLVGVIFGTIFMRHKQSLTVTMFAHGFYDMIGITLIYLDKERMIVDFIRDLINAA